MFERYADRSRRVLVFAQEAARRFGHSLIGPEHILIGLIQEEGGAASGAVLSAGLSAGLVRVQVGEMLGGDHDPPTSSPPFTPRALRILELASRGSLQLGHPAVDSEHLLLGLLREGESVAVRVLANLGVDLDELRRKLIELMSVEHRGSTDEISVRRAIRVESGAWTEGGRSEPPSSDVGNQPRMMRPPPPKVPAAMASELATRCDRLPVDRVPRDADFWALRRVEEEHIDRVACRHKLDEVTRQVASDWWLGEVHRRREGARAWLVRQGRRRLQHNQRRRSFRSNAVFQLYWNTLGPRGRTWFGNRYATIRRYTFRIRWRP